MADHHAFRGRQQPLILTVPGLANSGPGHWQTLWEQQRSDCHRVELGQWDQPHRNSWVNQLNLAIRASGQGSTRPVVLVAHSLGCLAVAWWALLEAGDAVQRVAGALLVAPPDVDTTPCDPRLSGFAPAPAAALPFPCIVVASRNDPYMTMRGARRLAHAWGASFADAGAIGHINAASGIADWPFGRFLLGQMLARCAVSETSVPAGEAARGAHARKVLPAGTLSGPPLRRFADPSH